jgi:2'-5' RNA ligase
MDVVNRAFLGLKLPQNVNTALADVQMTLKRKAIAEVRWNDPGQFVLTLVSLGEISIDRLAQAPVYAEIGTRGFGPMNLSLDGLTGIPNLVQPRYVSMNFKGDVEPLKRLQASLTRAMLPIIGMPPDGKPFEPHIILGRLKQESEPQRVALGRGIRLMQNATAGNFVMDRLELIRNEAADGISYHVVKSFPLGI